MRIGVLASQGAFIEHITVLKQLDTEAVPVRLPGELKGLDGLIIPGGESTTISRLMTAYNLIEKIGALARGGLPLFGTCAGMILMAKEISQFRKKFTEMKYCLLEAESRSLVESLLEAIR